MLLRLEEEVLRMTGLDDSHRWHFSAQKIRDCINKVESPLDKQLLVTRWEECVHIARKKPANKSAYFHQFRSILSNLAHKLPETSEKNLEAQGLSKKKFKDKDEEAKFFSSCKEKLEEDLGSKLLEEIKVDEEEAFRVRLLEDKQHRFSHDSDYINKLSRIKGPKDVEAEGKRIMAKFSLRVKMDKCSFTSPKTCN